MPWKISLLLALMAITYLNLFLIFTVVSPNWKPTPWKWTIYMVQIPCRLLCFLCMMIHSVILQKEEFEHERICYTWRTCVNSLEASLNKPSHSWASCQSFKNIFRFTLARCYNFLWIRSVSLFDRNCWHAFKEFC